MRGAKLLLAAAVCLPASAGGQSLTADEIMARVATNQDRAQERRKAYAHNQVIRARLFRGKNKLAREQTRWYAVTPTARGVKRELTKFRGRLRWKGELVEHDQPDYRTRSVDLDGELAESFSEMIADDPKSRDGIGQGWFPLTKREQRKYRFQLQGQEEYRGRGIYRVTFEPVRKGSLLNEDLGIWKGEVLVDAGQFQPVLIVTEMAKGFPLWAKTVFGTNVRQVGFKMTYEEFEDGIWFPVSYGGEFKLTGLFFYKRTISLSMQNRDFSKADVTSQIEYEPIAGAEPR